MLLKQLSKQKIALFLIFSLFSVLKLVHKRNELKCK